MTIAEIEQAIAKLSREELSAFRAWFAEFDADRWGEEIAEDEASGKLDKLTQRALAEHKAGTSREL